jgi:flagellar basal body-associated protein FliL
MREALSLLVVSVLFGLGVVGIIYWLLAYKDAREDKRLIMFTPIWIFMPQLLTNKGNHYRKRFIQVTVAAGLIILFAYLSIEWKYLRFD